MHTHTHTHTHTQREVNSICVCVCVCVCVSAVMWEEQHPVSLLVPQLGQGLHYYTHSQILPPHTHILGGGGGGARGCALQEQHPAPHPPCWCHSLSKASTTTPKHTPPPTHTHTHRGWEGGGGKEEGTTQRHALQEEQHPVGATACAWPPPPHPLPNITPHTPTPPHRGGGGTTHRCALWEEQNYPHLHHWCHSLSKASTTTPTPKHTPPPNTHTHWGWGWGDNSLLCFARKAAPCAPAGATASARPPPPPVCPSGASSRTPARGPLWCPVPPAPADLPCSGLGGCRSSSGWSGPQTPGGMRITDIIQANG